MGLRIGAACFQPQVMERNGQIEPGLRQVRRQFQRITVEFYSALKFAVSQKAVGHLCDGFRIGGREFQRAQNDFGGAGLLVLCGIKIRHFQIKGRQIAIALFLFAVDSGQLAIVRLFELVEIGAVRAPFTDLNRDIIGRIRGGRLGFEIVSYIA